MDERIAATLTRSRLDPPQNPKLPRRLLGKAILAVAMSAKENTSAEMIVSGRYHGNDAIHRAISLVTRAATSPTGTTPELVSTIVAEWQAALMPVSAVQQLAAIGRNFTPVLGQRTIVPARAPRSATGAAWVAEAGVIPVVQVGVAAGTLEPHKAAAIAAFTDELDNASNGQAEKILTDLLAEDLAALLDASLADAVAANAQRPAGLLHGVAPVASVDRAADLGVIFAGFAAMQARTPAILAHPTRLASLYSDAAFGPQLAQNRIGPAAVISSYYLPADVLIGVDASAVAIGLGVPEILASRSAALTMANADGTAPTQAIDATGAIATPGEVSGGIHVRGGASGAGTAGVVAMSLLQQMATAVRLIEPATWALLRSGVVVAVNGVAW